MTTHKITAGDGYTYLTRQVAAGDSSPQRGKSAAEYYTETGNPPGRWISGLVVRFRRLRAYRQLRPLWQALYERDPGIALDAPRVGRARWWRTLTRPKEVGRRISRRLIEVRDGMLAMHPYLDPYVAEGARREAAERGLSGTDLAAAAEAEQIRAALEASLRPNPHRREADSATVDDVPDNFDAEMRWLSAVAVHFVAAHRRCTARSTAPPLNNRLI